MTMNMSYEHNGEISHNMRSHNTQKMTYFKFLRFIKLHRSALNSEFHLQQPAAVCPDDCAPCHCIWQHSLRTADWAGSVKTYPGLPAHTNTHTH